MNRFRASVKIETFEAALSTHRCIWYNELSADLILNPVFWQRKLWKRTIAKLKIWTYCSTSLPFYAERSLREDNQNYFSPLHDSDDCVARYWEQQVWVRT